MVLKGKVVLIVEDEPVVASVMKDALEDEGCIVHCSGTGKEAIRYSAQVRPHVVLLDVMLPEMDGETVGKALYQRYGPGVPIVIVSAVDKPKMEELASHVNAFGTVSKPFELEELLDTVERAAAEEQRRASEGESE